MTSMDPREGTPTYDITDVEPDEVAVEHAQRRLDNATEDGDQS